MCSDYPIDGGLTNVQIAGGLLTLATFLAVIWQEFIKPATPAHLFLSCCITLYSCRIITMRPKIKTRKVATTVTKKKGKAVKGKSQPLEVQSDPECDVKGQRGVVTQTHDVQYGCLTFHGELQNGGL